MQKPRFARWRRSSYVPRGDGGRDARGPQGSRERSAEGDDEDQERAGEKDPGAELRVGVDFQQCHVEQNSEPGADAQADGREQTCLREEMQQDVVRRGAEGAPRPDLTGPLLDGERRDPRDPQGGHEEQEEDEERHDGYYRPLWTEPKTVQLGCREDRLDVHVVARRYPVADPPRHLIRLSW